MRGTGSGPTTDWAHLPVEVADAIRGLANWLTQLEELVAEQTGRKPEGADVKPLRRRGGPGGLGDAPLGHPVPKMLFPCRRLRGRGRPPART